MFDIEKATEPIPPGLDEMEPGVALAGFLASIDVDTVSGGDRVVVLRAHHRMAAHYQAQTYADMVSVVETMDGFADDDDGRWWAPLTAAAEIRAALRLTRRAADTEVELAMALKYRLPKVQELLASGRIDVRRAKVIVSGTIHLPDHTARNVVDQIVDKAPKLTTGQLGALLRRLRIEADPDDAKHQYEDAVADRRMVVEANVSGTANLLGPDLPPHRAAAVSRRIDRIARSLRTADETRTMDQLRADVYLDLLEGAMQHAPTGTDRGVVDICVDLETLTRLAHTPGEPAGYGPVVADIARRVAEDQHDAEWRCTITDPETGLPVHTGITRRRPTAAQRRMVQTRDRTCVFPGCRMPAVDCDLDHRIPWSERGPTDMSHLVAACRHDHVIKHRGWAHQPLPRGDHLWTSPLGHRYTTSGEPP
jgi:hypothetical protein